VGLEELTSRDAVLEAIAEFDRLGRDAFLAKYGYGGSKRYRIVHDGGDYDLKAIAGAAYGYQYPDHGPLGRDEFGSGRRSTVPKLESLGFEVRAIEPVGQGGRTWSGEGASAYDGHRVWLIRAGREGENEKLALARGMAIIGWSELGDVGGASRDELKEAIRDVYGEQRPQSLASQGGEVYRFVNDVRRGDLVVLPLRSDRGHVAVGRVSGDYVHRSGPEWGPDARNTRETEWLGRRVPYERFDSDLRDAFGQQGTVSEIAKPESAKRILAAASLAAEGGEGDRGSPLHLVLKWSEERNPETIQLHREVAEGGAGAVWWGRFTKNADRRGLSERSLDAFKRQLERGETTFVFLHGASTWRTRLLDITLDEADVEQELVPDYYDPDTRNNLWVKLTDFEQVEPEELMRSFVLAANGAPVRKGSLGNQGPLIVRSRVGGAAVSRKVSTDFDVDAVRKRAADMGLRLPALLYRQVVAALESGKHVILTGPPGTAKTTLAQAVAEVAAAAGRCDGYLPTTATADWTTFETIGGLKPTGHETLEFEPGHFLEAIEGDQWLLIDELNRSNFDRAFGQLFTVLSGQAVTLPYARGDGRSGPIVLLPEGSPRPADGDVLPIPASWRIVATMNVFDKTLLFEMSFALMRRFAFIEVPSPDAAVFEALIEREAGGVAEAADLAKRLLGLRELKDLGPAVYIDIARYLRRRIPLAAGEGDGRLLFEAFYSYLLPQFEGIDSREGEALFKRVGGLVGSGELRERLRRTLNAVLGLDLLAPGSGGAEEDLEPA
jgi:AAA domain (dynein-related subfamily)